MLDRPRSRPGRKDITERKKAGRSEPYLDQDSGRQSPANYKAANSRPGTARRPGKRGIDNELARSEPDLNRRPSEPRDRQPSRQPSFLRATEGDEVQQSQESLNDILERQRNKRDMYDDDYLANPPPPYDYEGGPIYESARDPPAYSPPNDYRSDSSDYNYPSRYNNRPMQRGPPYRGSDRSDSDYGRSMYPANPRFAPQLAEDDIDGSDQHSQASMTLV